MLDGSAGVKVGQRTVPLDSITADTMPNEATLINADENQGELQDLFSRQVHIRVTQHNELYSSTALLSKTHAMQA